MEKLIERSLITREVPGIDLHPALWCDATNAQSLTSERHRLHRSGFRLTATSEYDRECYYGKKDYPFHRFPLSIFSL